MARYQSAILTKHIVTIRGDYSPYYYTKTASRWSNVILKMNYVLNSLDAIACLCDEQINFFESNFPKIHKNLHLIYNGFKPNDSSGKIAERAELGLPVNAFLIGMVSRGVEKKGWQKAIDAFVQANITDVYLVLVGGGHYLETLSKNTDHPNIIFKGYSANTIEYIQHFDLCLLPTLFPYESLPTVIMEYLYCGKPVIATDVGEIKKMLTDDKGLGEIAGDLLTFNDQDVNVNELTSLIKLYVTDEEYLRYKAGFSSGAFQKFELENCIRAYEILYNS